MEVGATFNEIVKLRRRYVSVHYGKPTIVFDGYGNDPSIKDHEHTRRTLKSAGCPNVKMGLITLISQKLIIDGSSIGQSTNDADTMIVSNALDLARNGDTVTVFANDTDVIIMLLHFWKSEMGNIVIRSEYSRNGGKQLKQLSMKDTVRTLSDTVIKTLLLIHAFGGCDITSAVHDKGKTTILRLLEKSNRAQVLSEVFSSLSSTPDQIGKAEVEILVLLYGGKDGDK